ncbi:hypothetical protein Tco_0683668, partial [Tanacetum coccineum]
MVESLRVTSSFLTLMVTLSRLKDAEMMRIKMKNPPLDQTGGPREDELEKNQSQPVLQRKRHPRQLASQLMGPNLNTSRKFKPLPLILNSRGRRVIPFDHFINNDLEYLSGGVSSWKYATSVTKTKDADYGHIKWIEDLVPNRMWSQVPVSYDKHALWGISWGRKRQQFYAFAANMESTKDVYSKRRIIAVTKLEIVEWHNYKHLDWITVRRDGDKLY